MSLKNKKEELAAVIGSVNFNECNEHDVAAILAIGKVIDYYPTIDVSYRRFQQMTNRWLVNWNDDFLNSYDFYHLYNMFKSIFLEHGNKFMCKKESYYYTS